MPRRELDAWVTDYNTDDRIRPSRWPRRPNGSGSRRDQRRRVRCPSMQHDDRAGQWVLRRVGSNGVMSVDNQMFSVGNAYKAAARGRLRGRHDDPGLEQNHLIKTVARTRSGPVRKIRADGLHVKHQPEPKVAISRNLTASTLVPHWFHVYMSFRVHPRDRGSTRKPGLTWANTKTAQVRQSPRKGLGIRPYGRTSHLGQKVVTFWSQISGSERWMQRPPSMT